MTGTQIINGIKRNRILLTILSIAAFLRLWHIGRAMEFLGDQGSAAVVIMDAWQQKILPLVGPTVSLGIRPGPLYYYLIAPWLILSGFNPVSVSVFFAAVGVLTVWLLYLVSKRLCGRDVGLIVAGLYAISPAVVTASRMMWNPTAIPFFVVLMIFTVLKQRDTQQYRYAVLTGLMAGCLVQLHYTTLIVSGCLLAVQVFLWKRIHKHIRVKHIVFGIGLWGFGFLLSLFPFLYSEWINNFPNIRELLLMLLGEGSPVSDSLRSEPAVAYGFSLELFRNVIPFMWNIPVWLLQVVFLAIAVMRGSRWGKIFACVYIVGILVMSRYSGPMFSHYFYFLLPIPFIITGFVFSEVGSRSGKTVLWSAGVLLLVWVGIGNLRPHQYPDDIARTSESTQRMITAAANKPFSFTLTRSRSFSDFHYRFYFQLFKVSPFHIADTSYPILFLVCEQLPCPTHEELERPRILNTMCSDHHCSGRYPEIFFDDWEYTSTLNGPMYTIYQYQRVKPVSSGG